MWRRTKKLAFAGTHIDNALQCSWKAGHRNVDDRLLSGKVSCTLPQRAAISSVCGIHSTVFESDAKAWQASVHCAGVCIAKTVARTAQAPTCVPYTATNVL